MEKYNWITINYHLPTSPSGGRVYTWRKLKELGAEYLRQGMAVLPSSKANLQGAQQLAAKIRTMGGEATLAEMRFVEEGDQERMVAAFKTQSQIELREVLRELAKQYEQTAAAGAPGDSKVLHKRYIKAKKRDFFDAEAEMDLPQVFGELFGELNLDGGWEDLCADLRQGYQGFSKLFAGFRQEKSPGQKETEGDGQHEKQG